MIKKILFVIILFSVLLPGCSDSYSGKRINSYSRTCEIMGTFLQIKIREMNFNAEEIENILDSTVNFARSLENILSIYVRDSEINRLNQSRELYVSDDLFDVLASAYKVGVITEGGFDITVSPVLKKDGFYADMPVDILKQIPDNIDGMGWKNIRITEDHKVTLLNKDTWLDLSGIAKGFIVDMISDFLKDKGVNSFLINAGGDIFCGDNLGRKGGWLIGLREPDGSSVIKVLSLKNKAVATSGDYENVVIDNKTGEKLSHIIDPKNKTALDEKISSVTVIASDCVTADAFATGLMVMGLDAAINLGNKISDIDVITAVKKENNDLVSFSDGAERYIMEGN